ncbi:MAG: enolase C-terminal domain-like protein [Planctomycetota bacterium]|jgi:L-alanine-DL-glutamate epimerase-like enolase superfamily enzyme
MVAAFLPHRVRGEEGYPPETTTRKITKIEIVKYQGPTKTADHLEIVSDAGAVGRFGPLGWGIPKQLQQMSASLDKLLVGKDPLDRKLEFETFWDALHPGNPLAAYADGVDPLTRQKVWGTTRGERRRHTETGVEIMTLSAVDNALWDLRGKLLNKPVHRLIGRENRQRIDVYTRVGEGRNLDQARMRARELYDRGHKHQKWYFVYGPSAGRKGLSANLELVRVLREELGPDAVLMFDNHSMRYEIGASWVVSLAKQMLPYKPFWLEEPTAPEDIEGYARIKGETGITVAGGEHHYTRWQIKALLDRKSLDWVQSDPDWCGGISEWLRVCTMVRHYPGVLVVPHSDHILTNCQCVASQGESLCPMLEYNEGQTRSKLSFRTRSLHPEAEVLTMSDEPGLGPDIDFARCKRL